MIFLPITSKFHVSEIYIQQNIVHFLDTSKHFLWYMRTKSQSQFDVTFLEKIDHSDKRMTCNRSQFHICKVLDLELNGQTPNSLQVTNFVQS